MGKELRITCEANAYLKRKNRDDYEELLCAVDTVLPTPDGLMLESIFGERKILKAKIKELQLVDHKILLEEI